MKEGFFDGPEFAAYLKGKQDLAQDLLRDLHDSGFCVEMDKLEQILARLIGIHPNQITELAAGLLDIAT